MSMAAANDLVLVTGGSGFIAAWCIVKLVNKGYRVRTSVRSLQRSDEVQAMLKTGGLTQEQVNEVEIVALDLLKDEGWSEAATGVKYMLHVASPFPPGKPQHEDEVVKPAIEGTMRALKAAKQTGIRRVVITSSMAAIAYGHSSTKHFTEADWSVLGARKEDDPYQKSKTLAEKAAWDWAKENPEVEVSVINPALVLGPILGRDTSTSIDLVARLMNGEVPGLPQLRLGVVDVRDVADLHVLAMENQQAKGERFICTSDDGFVSMKEMSLALRERLGHKARKCATMVIPNFVINIVGLWDPQVALIRGQLGKQDTSTNAKARDILGWRPRDYKDALVATAESLEQEGMIKA